MTATKAAKKRATKAKRHEVLATISNPEGRPPEYQPGFVDLVRDLCRFGATDVEVADFLKVSVATLFNWKAENPEFLEAFKVGKEAADVRVERSLYHRAIGYTHDAVKIFMPAGADAPVYAPYREHVPPSDTAISFWLRNRKPDEWRDVNHQKHSGSISVNVAPEETGW